MAGVGGQKKYSILKVWAKKAREPGGGCKKAAWLAALPDSQTSKIPPSIPWLSRRISKASKSLIWFQIFGSDHACSTQEPFTCSLPGSLVKIREDGRYQSSSNPVGLCPREPHAGGPQLDFRGGAHPSKGNGCYPVWIVPFSG